MNASDTSDTAKRGTRRRSAAPRAEARAVALLQRRAEEAAALLKALANPDRLAILCQLVSREHSVGDIGSITGIGQPTLSQQLGILRGEGLVATRREGKHVHYRIESPAVGAVLRTLYELYCSEDAPRAGPAH